MNAKRQITDGRQGRLFSGADQARPEEPDSSGPTTELSAPAMLLLYATDALRGMQEAIQVMDLMGRGHAARDLALYRSNLQFAVDRMRANS